MHNAVLKNRVQTLLNAADGGNSLCAGGFNPFGVVHSSNISQACLDYMTTNATSTEKLDQTIVQGTVQGALFKLPAGDVRMAVLGAWRKTPTSTTPTPIWQRRTSKRYSPHYPQRATSMSASGAQFKCLAQQFTMGRLSIVGLRHGGPCGFLKAISNGGRSIRSDEPAGRSRT
jgi:hypothetical protein